MSHDSADRYTGLVRANGDDLVRYFARRVSSAEDAAELANDTLLVVWRRYGAVPSDDVQARMWMFGVARKVLHNHERTSRRTARLAEAARENLVQQIDEARSADRAHDDHATAVRDQVSRLPARQRELVRLVHWDGFTLKDAAQVIGISASTARTHYQLARATLRAALAADAEIVAARTSTVEAVADANRSRLSV